MDKKATVESVPERSERASHTARILAVTVTVLTVALVAITICAGLYIRDLQDTCIDNSYYRYGYEYPPQHQEECDLGLTMDNVHLQEHVTFSEESGMEFIVLRHSESNHIAFITAIDHNKGLQTLYDSATRQCYVVKSVSGDFHQQLEMLRNNDGQDMDTTVDQRQFTIIDSGNLDDIPQEMTPFCSGRNTNWLQEETDSASLRQKRRDIRVLCIVCFSDGNCYWAICTFREVAQAAPAPALA